MKRGDLVLFKEYPVFKGIIVDDARQNYMKVLWFAGEDICYPFSQYNQSSNLALITKDAQNEV